MNTLTSATTLATMNPLDAYQLGVLDERVRQAEQAREDLLLGAATAKAKPSHKPKAPKAPEPPPTNGEHVTSADQPLAQGNDP